VSEIGIIFLLFALGLEFSFRKLLKVGSSAMIMAGTQVIGMFVVGVVLGNALGWTSMEGIFLGGLMSMSSTAIIIKAYEDMGLKNKPYASLVFGALVVEDLIAIILLVLLSTMAVSNKFAGGEMLWGIAKLVFFLVLWFLVGIFVIPSLLNKARKYMNDEILLLVSIGLCFGMVVLADKAGFSTALGAFVMGSILSETLEGEHIEKLVKSLKDLFGAIFFVSVGMMVNPQVIGENWVVVLVLSLATIAGITFFSTSGVLLAGKGLDNAVHAGFSLAQLGEFSFIIAGLGCSLGVMRDFIYPIIIAVSVITTFTTPYMIKLSNPAYHWLNRKLPRKILDRLNPSQEAQANKSAAEESQWRQYLKPFFIRILIFGIILLAILIGSKLYLDPLADKLIPNFSGSLKKLIVVGATLLFAAPFMYGLNAESSGMKKSAEALVKSPKSKYQFIALSFARISLTIGFVMVVLTAHFKLSWWLLLLVAAAIATFLLFARRTASRYSKIESQFFSNLNSKEEERRRKAPISSFVSDHMTDLGIEPIIVDVPLTYKFIGKQIKEQPFRDESGVNIVKIQRGNHNILIPGGKDYIYPGDKLLAVGTPEQNARFVELMKKYSPIETVQQNDDFKIKMLTINGDSLLLNKSLKELNLREARCMIINIVRGNETFSNPRADFKIQLNDKVWLAGEKTSIEWYE